MWEEIACEQTDGHRLTNYYIDTVSSTVNYDTKKGRKKNNYLALAFGPPSKEIDVIYKGVKELHHYTEMRFTNFLSGRFVTITIVNQPDENRVCHTSVQ